MNQENIINKLKKNNLLDRSESGRQVNNLFIFKKY